MLLGLDGIEHLRKAWRILLMPSPIPAVNLFWIVMKVKQNGCSLHQCSHKDMCAKQIALPNKLPNRQRDTNRLWDDDAGHPLMIGELASMSGWSSAGILLHHGGNNLIKMK